MASQATNQVHWRRYTINIPIPQKIQNDFKAGNTWENRKKYLKAYDGWKFPKITYMRLILVHIFYCAFSSEFKRTKCFRIRNRINLKIWWKFGKIRKKSGNRNKNRKRKSLNIMCEVNNPFCEEIWRFYENPE